ncbi:MAG: phosphoribosyl-ATP diphosphatase [Oscillospiraceae bacterium]|nr:phosphoribosyl-ATP diphosphatase [Oscillospiraceae bacterium]
MTTEQMNALYEEYKIILERKNDRSKTPENEKSYTKYLFKEGINKILKKIGEETSELIIAAKDADTGSGAGDRDTPVIEETADLFYHVLILLAELGIPLSELEAEFEARAAKTGNLKESKSIDKNT